MAVAALSHRNILSIFDFGTYEGTAYAVTELLEGETLRGKLDSGPIAQKQAAQIRSSRAKTAEKTASVRSDPEHLVLSPRRRLKSAGNGNQAGLDAR